MGGLSRIGAAQAWARLSGFHGQAMPAGGGEAAARSSRPGLISRARAVHGPLGLSPTRRHDEVPMNWGVMIRTALVVAILIVLHFTLRPLLGWRASIDFLLIALVFGAVRMRPGVAAVYGLLLGLAADSLSVSTFGASGLGMTVVGYAASYLKAVFFADNLALNGFFIFMGKWVFDVIFFLMSGQLGGRSW